MRWPAKFAKVLIMTAPYSELTDSYRTDGDTNLADHPSYNEFVDYRQTPASPMVPYAPAALPNLEERERRRERNAVTARIAIALSMAIPLTAIAGGVVGSFGGGFGALIGMAMAWAGMAIIVYLSHGKGFPYPRSG